MEQVAVLATNITVLNEKLSQGFKISQHYGDFVLLEKEKKDEQ
jgi:hypothetical protein